MITVHKLHDKCIHFFWMISYPNVILFDSKRFRICELFIKKICKKILFFPNSAIDGDLIWKLICLYINDQKTFGGPLRNEIQSNIFAGTTKLSDSNLKVFLFHSICDWDDTNCIKDSHFDNVMRFQADVEHGWDWFR
jgi:hypothetical protein